MFHERAPPGNIPARSISDCWNEEMTKIAILEIANLAAVQPWDRSGVYNESIQAGRGCHRTIRAVQTWIPETVNRARQNSLYGFSSEMRMPSVPTMPLWAGSSHKWFINQLRVDPVNPTSDFQVVSVIDFRRNYNGIHYLSSWNDCVPK